MGDAAVWRAWAADADPDLLEDFNVRSSSRLQDVRRDFPPDCGPGHPMYLDLRKLSVDALNLLAEELSNANNQDS
jgi:hypothetical protein